MAHSDHDVQMLFRRCDRLEGMIKSLQSRSIIDTKLIVAALKNINKRLNALEAREPEVPVRPECYGTLDGMLWESGECGRCPHFDGCFNVAF